MCIVLIAGLVFPQIALADISSQTATPANAKTQAIAKATSDVASATAANAAANAAAANAAAASAAAKQAVANAQAAQAAIATATDQNAAKVTAATAQANATVALAAADSANQIAADANAAATADYVAATGSVSATTSTAGDVFCNASNNIGPLIDVLDWLAYTAGAFVICSGVYMLARHTEAPGQAPIPKAIARLLGGTLLLSLPDVSGVVIDSIFGIVGDGSGLAICQASSTTTTGTNITLDVMLTNMVTNIRTPLITLLSTLCAFLGVLLITRGLLKATKYGEDPRTYSITAIVSSLVFGSIFMVIGQSLDVMMSSVLGDSSIHTFDSLAWTAINNLSGDTTQFKNAIKAALTFFQLVGFISFVRGWNVLKNSVEGSGQATVAQGLTHIIGGVLAINIYYFIAIMDKTFGTSFAT